MLILYDPEKPLVLGCNTSPYGLGVVLLHTLPHGLEKPIDYSSRTLSSSKKNYSQIEKESLAIIFAIKKIHQYIFGRHVTIEILSEEKGIPQLVASSLQRRTFILSGYNKP